MLEAAHQDADVGVVQPHQFMSLETVEASTTSIPQAQRRQAQ